MSVKFLLAVVVSCTLAGSAFAQGTGPCSSIFDAPAQSGQQWPVNAGDDLQAALDSAQPGDEVVLQQGASFSGSFHLPNKADARYITVRSSASPDSLPAPGMRATPDFAPVMARIVGATQGDAPLTTDAGAHHWRFVGVELQSTPGVYSYNVIALGTGTETQLSDLPHDLVFDRVYIHGDPVYGVKIGISINSATTTIANSYISDVKGVNQDTQAIIGWNGPGPFTIVNNYLEAAGENVMFGGADPTIPDLVPSDITFRYNRLAKPLAWKADDPSFAGTHWSVKNLLELKNARRVVVDGNLFEQSWADAQSGEAALFTVRNQDGGAPWSTVESVQFTNNVVRHTGGGLSILGHDNNNPSQLGHDFVVENNLFYDVGGARWGGFGRLITLGTGTTEPGPANVRIDHNTSLQTGDPLVSATPDQVVDHPGLVFTGNVVANGPHGVWGDAEPQGDATLATYYGGALFTGNVLVGAAADFYAAHPGNFFPLATEAMQFADATAGNFRVGAGAYGDAGVDMIPLDAAAACLSP